MFPLFTVYMTNLIMSRRQRKNLYVSQNDTKPQPMAQKQG